MRMNTNFAQELLERHAVAINVAVEDGSCFMVSEQDALDAIRAALSHATSIDVQVGLPPLPPVDGYDKRIQGHYSAQQMQDYARAALAATGKQQGGPDGWAFKVIDGKWAVSNPCCGMSHFLHAPSLHAWSCEQRMKPVDSSSQQVGEVRGIPGNVITHRRAWRKALEVARDAAEVSPPDINDYAYWEHEIRAFDRTFDRLWALIDQRDAGLGVDNDR